MSQGREMTKVNSPSLDILNQKNNYITRAEVEKRNVSKVLHCTLDGDGESWLGRELNERLSKSHCA